MKKQLLSLLALLITTSLFASTYKISDVEYKIDGITREYSLKTSVPVDFKRVFKDEDELINYIKDIKKQIENTRNFDVVQVDFTVSEPDEDDSCNVVLKIFVDDSKHLIITPYPKYSSGDAFNFFIKAKDTNFLGSMESLTADLKFAIELDDNDKAEGYLTGFGINFDIPFQMGQLDAVWGNDIDFSYTFGDSTPEWSLDTNLQLTKSFKKFSVVTKFSQLFVRDLDYEDEDINGMNYHYGDGTYFGEKINFSIPITIQEVDNWGKIYYTPFFTGTYYWDFDGIDENNSDLRGPTIAFGQTLSTGRVNWEKNFRTGLVASITNSFGYDFAVYEFIPAIYGELQGYKAFNRFGFCTDIYAFAVMNGTYGFGDRLRGIRDEQYFSNSSGHMYEKACYSTAGLIVNIDLPIRICRIYWDQMPVIKHIGFAKYFNLEAQISPFMDLALFHNEAAGTTFNLKDGFLSGGLEGIIYPLKWKGIQIRGSLGVDLSRKMPKIKRLFDQGWRRGVKSYEISIGLGLQY